MSSTLSLILALIFFSLIMALGLWDCICFIPQVAVPLKRAYDQVIELPCDLLSGVIKPTECCFQINATIRLYINETSSQTTTQVYRYYGIKSEAEEDLAKMPYNSTCKVNPCDPEYQGDHSSDSCYTEIPFIITNISTGVSSLFLLGIIYMLPMVGFIVIMVILIIKTTIKRRGYVDIN
jgi:hypothetical protein